jgi:hypothetical protein
MDLLNPFKSLLVDEPKALSEQLTKSVQRDADTRHAAKAGESLKGLSRVLFNDPVVQNRLIDDCAKGFDGWGRKDITQQYPQLDSMRKGAVTHVVSATENLHAVQENAQTIADMTSAITEALVTIKEQETKSKERQQVLQEMLKVQRRAEAEQHVQAVAEAKERHTGILKELKTKYQDS